MAGGVTFYYRKLEPAGEAGEDQHGDLEAMMAVIRVATMTIMQQGPTWWSTRLDRIELEIFWRSYLPRVAVERRSERAGIASTPSGGAMLGSH